MAFHTTPNIRELCPKPHSCFCPVRYILGALTTRASDVIRKLSLRPATGLLCFYLLCIITDLHVNNWDGCQVFRDGNVATKIIIIIWVKQFYFNLKKFCGIHTQWRNLTLRKSAVWQPWDSKIYLTPNRISISDNVWGGKTYLQSRVWCVCQRKRERFCRFLSEYGKVFYRYWRQRW